ncbi:TSUP family transporter [Georgenia halophila]|uniref:Probable membrane transporter protein n=1 Tax=Georgenia halophila TaxID=620889 RepID=A0ABP8L4J8_9MICO
MPELAGPTWALLTVGALLVGLAKTALPGGGTLAVALFAAALPARASTGALLVLLIVGDLFAVWIYRAHADLAMLRRLAPPVIVGVLAGTAFLAVADNEGVRRTIGIVLLSLIALNLVQRWRRSRRDRVGATDGTAPADPAHGTGKGRRRALTLGYGTLGGFTTMVANAAGPVMSLYFLTASTSVNRFLGTAAWFFFAVNLAKTPFSISLGLIDTATLRLDLFLVPAVVVGALTGRVIARRLDFRLFDKLVMGLTVVSASYLVVA